MESNSCFLYIKAILAAETDPAEKLFVCNEALFWLGESCLHYIMLDLHLYASVERGGKKKERKTMKRKAWTASMACFFKHSPLNYLSILLSQQLNLFETFCPDRTHSSLTHHTCHYSTMRGQMEGA